MIAGVDKWHAKAEGKTAIDYGFHLITTDFEDKHTEEMYTLMDEGITSFKLFMAYPGVFLADDATIFRAMSAAGERGGLICMHAENGIVIDEIVKRALAAGKDRSECHHAHPADNRRGGGRPPRDRDRRNGGVARLHRSPFLYRRAEPGPRGSRPRNPRFRRDLSAVPVPFDRRLRRRLRRCEIRDDAAACAKNTTTPSCGRA